MKDLTYQQEATNPNSGWQSPSGNFEKCCLYCGSNFNTEKCQCELDFEEENKVEEDDSPWNYNEYLMEHDNETNRSFYNGNNI